MTTDNKLFQCILQSGRQQAEIIEKEAQDDASKIIEDAEKAAKSEAQSIKLSAQRQAERIKNSALSSAALTARNAVLNAKRAEINSALDGILDYLCSLDDESYFELLYKAAGGVSGEYDEILLNEKDLKRVPADFIGRLASCGVKAALSDTPANIEGGFILKDGSIETNCSFAAVIEDKRSEIEDFINLELFGREGE